MRIIIAVLLNFMLLAVPMLAIADGAMDQKKQLFIDQNRQMVLDNMKLTAEEAEAFWPVFGEYQDKIFRNWQEYGRVVKAYASVYQTMTNSEALTLIDEYYQVMDARQVLMKQYTDLLRDVLPGKKLFRYLQIVNKLDAIARFELSKEIPLVQ